MCLIAMELFRELSSKRSILRNKLSKRLMFKMEQMPLKMMGLNGETEISTGTEIMPLEISLTIAQIIVGIPPMIVLDALIQMPMGILMQTRAVWMGSNHGMHILMD